MRNLKARNAAMIRRANRNAAMIRERNEKNRKNVREDGTWVDYDGVVMAGTSLVAGRAMSAPNR